MSKNKHVCHVESGSIYNNIAEKFIDRPAILLDAETGTVLRWGEFAACSETFDTTHAAFKSNGIPCDLLMLDLSDSPLNADEVCYLIRRCVEYTASGFQSALCEHVRLGDAEDWLRSEMRRVPILDDDATV